MAGKQFIRVQPQGNAPTAREFVDAQSRLEQSLNPVLKKEIVDGILLEDVELLPFEDNTILHGLGRRLRGFYVVKRSVPTALATFRAQLAANQTIATSTTTVVDLAQQEYDEGANFRTSTGKYTAPVDGLYWFTWAGHINNLTAGVIFEIFPVKNDNDCGLLTWIQGNGVNTVAASGHGNIRLVAGDVMGLDVYHQHGSDRTLQDSAYTYFAGGLVDEGVTDRQSSLTAEEQAKKLILRCSFTQTVSLWVF